MTTIAKTRSAWRLVVTLAAVLCAATYLLVAWPSVRASWYGASQFQDDTFYYLVTAKNFLHLGVFTFDGRNVTNGFQPLWMAAMVGLFRLIGQSASLELQIFAVNLLEKILLGVAAALGVLAFARAYRRGLPWAVGYLALALVLFDPFFFIFDQGMETTLAVLLLLVVTYAFLEEKRLLLGVALALLFLARLDTAVFVAAPLITWSLATARRGDSRQWAGLAIVAVTFLFYVGFNLVTTGHAVPISGAIRSSFPILRWQGAFFTEPITLARMFGWVSLLEGINIVTCTGLVVLGAALLLASRPAREVLSKLAMLGAIAAFLIANLMLFQKWEKSLDPRYLAMPMSMSAMFAASAFAVAVERVTSWIDARVATTGRMAGRTSIALRALPLALVALLMLMEAQVHVARFNELAQRRDDPIRELFREIDRVLPRDAVIAGTDVGAIAFWTQRRTINLDGVINNFEYQDYLRAGALREYLRREGVTHIVTALWDREQTYTGRPIEPMYRQVLDPPAVHGLDYPRHEFYVYSYVYGVYSDHIALAPADEVYRKFLGKNGIADTTYVVYRLRD